MIKHLHAREIDLGAVQAVCRASAEGRRTGRQETLREAAVLVRRGARRARWILFLSVATALLVGFTAGLLLGATSPRAARAAETSTAR
jgi:hypothetical protein